MHSILAVASALTILAVAYTTHFVVLPGTGNAHSALDELKEAAAWGRASDKRAINRQKALQEAIDATKRRDTPQQP